MGILHRLGRFFKKLGFDKGDERSVLIVAYVARISWVYVTIALITWTLYEVIRFGRLGLPALLFFSSQAIFWFAYIHYQRKLGG